MTVLRNELGLVRMIVCQFSEHLALYSVIIFTFATCMHVWDTHTVQANGYIFLNLSFYTIEYFEPCYAK